MLSVDSQNEGVFSSGCEKNRWPRSASELPVLLAQQILLRHLMIAFSCPDILGLQMSHLATSFCGFHESTGLCASPLQILLQAGSITVKRLFQQ